MMDLSFTYSTFYACTDEPETGLRYSTGEADICINMYTCTRTRTRHARRWSSSHHWRIAIDDLSCLFMGIVEENKAIRMIFARRVNRSTGLTLVAFTFHVAKTTAHHVGTCWMGDHYLSRTTRWYTTEAYVAGQFTGTKCRCDWKRSLKDCFFFGWYE